MQVQKRTAVCDLERRSCIRWVYGFLYNDRVRVRKEDHVWVGRFGSERREF